MTVGTFDIDRLSVDQQLGVLDLYLTETHLLGNDLITITHHEGIEIGCLCRPLMGFPQQYLGASGNLPTLCVTQGYLWGCPSDGRQFHGERAVLIVIDQVWRDTDILDMRLPVLRIEIARTSYPTQPPEVLVLIIGAVAPAEGLEGYQVITWMHLIRDIKLSGDFRVLGIPYILAVDPQVHIRGDGTEMGDDLFTIPISRDVDRTAIGTHMIVLHRHLWRVILEMSTPGEAHIHILRVTIAVKFPDARHGHRLPVTVIIVFSETIRRALVGMLYPQETPCSIQ